MHWGSINQFLTIENPSSNNANSQNKFCNGIFDEDIKKATSIQQ